MSRCGGHLTARLSFHRIMSFIGGEVVALYTQRLQRWRLTDGIYWIWTTRTAALVRISIPCANIVSTARTAVGKMTRLEAEHYIKAARGKHEAATELLLPPPPCPLLNKMPSLFFGIMVRHESLSICFTIQHSCHREL